MSTNYFEETDKLFDICERHPQTIAVFAANGFPHMEDPEKRKTLGKTISLKQALQLKGKSIQLFSKLLIEAIEGTKSTDSSLNIQSELDGDITVVGALPCPVRIPLLEQIDTFAGDFTTRTGKTVAHDLKAASQGAGWIEKYITPAKTASDLPDIFLSAGFETFFDPELVGRFTAEESFHDHLPFEGANSSFDSIDIRDPKHDYSMIAVVPAVFLVNTNELGDLPMPESWEDILQPCFENRISLPVGDFDLFSALLVHIHEKYGEDGLRSLGRSMLESMHPAEMVKSEKKKSNKPIVTIMPYFFTKMTKNGGPMKAVWPKDGAIISPIFMMTKKDASDEVKEVINFFASKDVGEILANKGLFPSLNPDVDNELQPEDAFMWVGWDFIYNTDIPALIKKCEALFEESSK